MPPTDPARQRELARLYRRQRGRPDAPPTHCPWGHPYTPENTFYYLRRGRWVCRQCRACKRARMRRLRDRRRRVEGERARQREYQRRYRERNRERLAEAARRYRERNRDRVRAADRARWPERYADPDYSARQRARERERKRAIRARARQGAPC